ncbi:MAG: hypothetical protein HY831_01180 [Candidatus Aenigmarchaeota archaeon]|nr:hypothetical protein [Candidatus Aenigmarchaeota archaeon]
MTYSTTVGAELELNLLDRQGYLANRADDVLADLKRRSNRYVSESSMTQVEFNSEPASSIRELYNRAKNQLSDVLEPVCLSHGVQPASMSEYGAGRGVWRDGNERYDVYPRIIGETSNSELNRISGIHLHFSQHPDRKLDQYKVLIALDPSFAFASTSPIYDLRNGLNCHRVNLTRNMLFSEFPLHCKLPGYPTSLKDIEAENQLRHQQWMQKAIEAGIPEETFKELFSPENTGYHPIRKRDEEKFGPTGTFEVRIFDSAPLDILAGIAALYKGFQDRVFNDQIPVTVANADGRYSFSSSRIVLPTTDTLRGFERSAISRGLRSNGIQNYLDQALWFASRGLSEEDRKYLDVLNNSLSVSANPAEELLSFMVEKGIYGKAFTPDQCAQANLFMRDRYLKGLLSTN